MSDFDLSRLDAPNWALDELADHIVDRHHRYVQGAIPALREALDVALSHWGAKHAPLETIRTLFEEIADELESHMAKEEHILFPAIREMARARRSGSMASRAAFVTLAYPIRAMENEHDHAMQVLTELRRETRSYQPPAEADEAGRECYRQLARFDADLEVHIHLENDILFPRTLDLEQNVA
jgi:regulator of cell morphogenesis and NO signaling